MKGGENIIKKKFFFFGANNLLIYSCLLPALTFELEFWDKHISGID